jgi:GNAT superfamily N-acetyltransferase
MIRNLTPSDFNQVIALGEQVHGANYLDLDTLKHYYQLGIKDGINAHFVAEQAGEIIGFRLTFAANQWTLDEWCSPALWGVEVDKVCYFKSNTLAEKARGQGIGGDLLAQSIAAVKAQGAKAGVSHLWKQSPHNAAVRYFTKAGGRLIKEHPGRWNQANDGSDYLCVLCGNDCHCTACEMLISW